MEKSRLSPCLKEGLSLTNPKAYMVCTDLTQELEYRCEEVRTGPPEEDSWAGDQNSAL